MAFTNPLSKLSYKTRGKLTLGSGFVLHFCLGTFYLWGGISKFTVSYLNAVAEKNGTKNSVTIEQANIVFPFAFLAIWIGLIFGVKVSHQIGFAINTLVCSVLIGCTIIVSSFLIQYFYVFASLFGFFFGLLCGITYMAPFNTCYLYFPNQKGLVSGIIAGGFGFGSMGFLYLVVGIVDEKNILESYPKAILILGIIILFLGSASSFFHLRPSEEEVASEDSKRSQCQSDNATKPKEHNNSEAQRQSASNELQSVKAGLQTSFIYITMVLVFLFTTFGTMLMSQYKTFGVHYEISPEFLNIVGAVTSIFNGGGRIFWGFIFEKYDIKHLISVNLFVQIVLSSTLRFVAKINYVFLVYIVLGAFCYGGWFAMMPAWIVRVYGKRIGTELYSVSFFGFVIASFSQFLIVTYLKNLLSWDYTFFIFTGLQTLGLVLAYVLPLGLKHSPEPSNDIEVKSIVRE